MNGNGSGSGNGNGNGNGHGGKRPIRVLLAESNEAQRLTLKSAITASKRFNLVSVVSDGERAGRLAAQLQPDVVVLELGMKRADGSDTAESIAITTPSCQIIVLAEHNDPDVIRRAMMVGAREFLVKPVSDEQLVHTIGSVYDFAVKRQGGVIDDGADRQHACQVVSVWGPKGGVGRTFLAVNLAVAMAATGKRRVLLMDGCLGFCTADVALDIEGKKNIFDLVVDNDQDLDPDLVADVVVHHSTGVDVLLAPPVEDMLLIAPIHLQRIITMMRRLYDVVVVDTRPLLDETTVAFLDPSDTILTVCNPEIASLRNLRIFLDAAGRLGYGQEKVLLVINRYDMRGAIPQEEIQRICRHSIYWAISNDHEAVASSINRGMPLLASQPNRPITKEIGALAAKLDEVVAAAMNSNHNNGNGNGNGKAPKSAFGRLFGRSNN